jgi:hypothetical protein
MRSLGKTSSRSVLAVFNCLIRIFGFVMFHSAPDMPCGAVAPLRMIGDGSPAVLCSSPLSCGLIRCHPGIASLSVSTSVLCRSNQTAGPSDPRECNLIGLSLLQWFWYFHTCGRQQSIYARQGAPCAISSNTSGAPVMIDVISVLVHPSNLDPLEKLLPMLVCWKWDET